jgi:hypothetical protein
MKRLWQNFAGVYYPGEKPPAHVTLAKGVLDAPDIPASRLKKRAPGKRSPMPAAEVAQRHEELVACYRRTGSLEKTRREMRCGSGLLARVLATAGVQVPAPGRRRASE